MCVMIQYKEKAILESNRKKTEKTTNMILLIWLKRNTSLH